MHKGMKRETVSPPAANPAKQQRKLNLLQQRYNHERPHEALSGDFPAQRWQPSTKEYPDRLRQPEHPGHFEVRRVSTCGTFRLEDVGDAVRNIVYYNIVPGRTDLRTAKITGSENV